MFVQLLWVCECVSLCLYVIKILHFHEIEAMHMMCRWLCQRGWPGREYEWESWLRCVFMERWYRLSLVFIWSILYAHLWTGNEWTSFIWIGFVHTSVLFCSLFPFLFVWYHFIVLLMAARKDSYAFLFLFDVLFLILYTSFV